jgi:hypothetical protein
MEDRQIKSKQKVIREMEEAFFLGKVKESF